MAFWQIIRNGNGSYDLVMSGLFTQQVHITEQAQSIRTTQAGSQVRPLKK